MLFNFFFFGKYVKEKKIMNEVQIDVPISVYKYRCITKLGPNYSMLCITIKKLYAKHLLLLMNFINTTALLFHPYRIEYHSYYELLGYSYIIGQYQKASIDFTGTKL